MPDETQCGFSEGKGTTDAAYLLKSVSEAYYTAKTPLHLVFVDYKKAFDSVNHELMFAKLSELGVEGDVLRLIEDLYLNANGQLRWKGQLTQVFDTPAGVR